MSTYLITGASGFIGSHLCEFYLSRGNKVIGLDSLITGNISNLSEVKNDPNFKFIQADINENFQIEDKIDYILHFASPASPIDYLKIPNETLKTGSIGTFNVIDLALKNNSRLLVASTSEVYGDPLEHPQKESYFGNVNSIGPRSIYDEAKRYMETAVMSYHRTHDLDSRIVRIFNTYGPRMRSNDGRAIPEFFTRAILEENIHVFGDGSQTRSFCYIDDLVNGIDLLLNSNYLLPVNLGNPEEVTLLELAEEILLQTNSKSKILFKELPQDDPRRRRPDITIAKEILNWDCKIPRTEGLKKTYNYFNSLHSKGLLSTMHRKYD